MIITVLKNERSRSAVTLARALRFALPIRVTRGTFDNIHRCRGSRFVINWGVNAYPTNWRQRRISFSNTPEAVENCRNKIATFMSLDEAQLTNDVIQWTRDRHQAEEWLERDNKLVVRHTVTGHSGAGIQIVRTGTAVPAAPLYTRYFRKQAEYRLHVAFGRVILIQQKRRRNGANHEGDEALVRTHANGYVFAHNDLSCDIRNYRDSLSELALRACRGIGANHCAVDVLVNHEQDNRIAIVEINSAPALEATNTQVAWIGAFRDYIQDNIL